METYALIQEGRIWTVEEHETAPAMHPEMHWEKCTGIAAAVPGATFVDGIFTAPLPVQPATRWYVPYPRLCGRVRAAGKWADFVAAKQQLPAEEQEYLGTLEEGIANDDAKAIGFLEAVGLDPEEMLAR